MAQKRRASMLIFLILQNVVTSTVHQRVGPGECLQGWGAVAGMTPAVVNMGLNRLHSRFSESMRVINSNTTTNFLGINVQIHINNAVIGDLDLAPLSNYLRVANLTVTFLGGTMIYTTLFNGVKLGNSTTYDMTRQQMVLAVNLRSYRVVIDNIASVYKVALFVKNNNAVLGFSVRGTAGAVIYLQNALLVELKARLRAGSRYELMTFRLDENDDTRAVIPTSVDFTSEYDHSGPGNHVFAALAVMPGMDIPVRPRDYIFNKEQIIQPNTNLTFTFENQFLLHFLRSEIEKIDSLRNLQWTIRSGCPGKLVLLNAESHFNDDIDSAKVEITFGNDRLNVHIYASKEAAGRRVVGRCTIPYRITVEDGQFTFNRGNIRINNVEQRGPETWALYILTFGIGAIIVENINLDLDADDFSQAEQHLGALTSGMSFKLGATELSRYDDVIFKTDHLGNLQIGVVVSSP